MTSTRHRRFVLGLVGPKSIGLLFPLIALAFAATSGAAEHPLVGHWASPDEELMFFASGEFAFQEHGLSGKWTLKGRHLRFGIPTHRTRDAEVIQITPTRLVLQSSGKKQIYHRVKHR